MFFWKPWLDAMRFGFEVQSVIALRLLKIAAGKQRRMHENGDRESQGIGRCANRRRGRPGSRQKHQGGHETCDDPNQTPRPR
jgi:hypothetical protein